MSWNHKSRVVAMAIAIQPVAGTFTPPAQADIIPASPPTNGADLITAEDPTATGTVWTQPAVVLGKTGNAGTTAPLRGPGGSAPFAANGWVQGRVLQAAGFAEIINAAAVNAVLQAGSTTTALKLANTAPGTDDALIGYPVQQANIGAGQIKGTGLIVDYNGTTKVADLGETIGVAPAAGAAYVIPPNVTYVLGTMTTSVPLLSISIWRDKKRYDYSDCRVTSLTIDMPVANEQNQVFPSIEMQLKGLEVAQVDEASPVIPQAYLTSIPPARNGKFSLDRVALGHQSMRFTETLEVAGPSNIHQAQGQDAYEVMSGDRNIDLDLNQMNVSDFDLLTREDAQTTMPVMQLWGTVPGNRFGFTSPQVRLQPMSPGDRNGFVNLTGSALFAGVDKSATLTIWWDPA